MRSTKHIAVYLDNHTYKHLQIAQGAHSCSTSGLKSHSYACRCGECGPRARAILGQVACSNLLGPAPVTARTALSTIASSKSGMARNTLPHCSGVPQRIAAYCSAAQQAAVRRAEPQWCGVVQQSASGMAVVAANYSTSLSKLVPG